MSLSDKRHEFSKCLCLLGCYMMEKGYKFNFDDLKAKSGHSKNSNHYHGLACDINMFDSDGGYITSSQHAIWSDSHEHWETLSNNSAPMIISDANHFSFTHNGVW